MGYIFYFLIALAVLANGGQLQAGVEVSLPDYEREARIVFQGMCDGGKVSYSTYYKQGGYILEVAQIQPEGFFYFMKRYLGKEEGWLERYFVQATKSSSLKEIAHEAWDAKVKQVSVNYFNKLHDLESTCTKMMVS